MNDNQPGDYDRGAGAARNGSFFDYHSESPNARAAYDSEKNLQTVLGYHADSTKSISGSSGSSDKPATFQENIEFLIGILSASNFTKARFLLFFGILIHGAFTGIKNEMDPGVSGFLTMGLLSAGCISYFLILKERRNNFFVCLIPVLFVGFLDYLVVDYVGHHHLLPMYMH